MNDNYDNKMIETARKPNMLFNELTRKALQFLVPISLISFLLSYTSGFSFFFTYNFHFSALVLPVFAHVFDRKYMFLLCNGILAFLAKNLSTSSTSSNYLDFSGDLTKSTIDDHEVREDVVVKEEYVGANDEEVVEVEETTSLSDTAAEEEEGNEVDMSTEELNKKIEEFIRKVKKELGLKPNNSL